MTVVGTVVDAFVEGERVIALLSLKFETHAGNYRADITPYTNLNPNESAFWIDLEQYAEDAIGTPVRVGNPCALTELQEMNK